MNEQFCKNERPCFPSYANVKNLWWSNSYRYTLRHIMIINIIIATKNYIKAMAKDVLVVDKKLFKLDLGRENKKLS